MYWYKKCLSQYADFTGRARRKEYWMFYLFNVLIFLGFGVISALLSYLMGEAGAIIAVVIFVVYSLAIFIPGLAVTVRRLHDIDKSGWWLLLAFIPFGGLVLFVFYCIDGTPSPNRFGASPKGLDWRPSTSTEANVNINTNPSIVE